MKIHLFILFFLTINFCNSDPVQCEGVQASSIGYFSSCSSTKPFPLKVSATVTLTQRYGFSPSKSWKFYLRNYKGQITTIPGCSTTSPADTTYNPGANLTVGFTCYEMPRQLQQADVIQISFFDEYSSFRLIFLVPIIGYSNHEELSFSQIKVENENNNFQHNFAVTQNQPSQTVQCQRVQDSPKARYVNCSSTKPFPLKVTTTVTLLIEVYFVPLTDWRFWLRQAKGQIMKVDNCTLSNPPSGKYYKGDNVTVGVTCYELPRQLKQWDSIQITFFQVDNLTFLIPIIGYNLQPQQEEIELQQKQRQIQETLIVQKTLANNELAQVVSCQRVQDSTKAIYTKCSSTKPFPLKIQTTITLLKDQVFTKDLTWQFALRQAKGQIMKISNCITANPPSGSYKKGDNLTVGITCYQLPRELKQYDSIQMTWFFDLVYLIPIIGYNFQIISNLMPKTFNHENFEIQKSTAEIKSVQKEYLLKEKEE